MNIFDIFRDNKKPKLKVPRLEQPTSTSKHEFYRRRVTEKSHQELLGLLKFLKPKNEKGQ